MVQEATQGPSPEVSLAVTLFFAAFLVGMILCLAFEEKLHAQKSLIVGLFAVATLLAGAVLLPLPYGPYLIGGHEVALPVYIPAIDWGVITIILGASLFVDVTSRSGLFTWIAIRLTKASRGDPRKLLWYYGIMTVAFSAVLNNVTAMIIVGSLSAVSLSKLQRSDKLLGFLLVEGLLTNVGGLLTLISSVPNIIVGTAAGISFIAFFIKRPRSFSSSRSPRCCWAHGSSRSGGSPPQRRSRKRLASSRASTSETVSKVEDSSGSGR